MNRLAMAALVSLAVVSPSVAAQEANAGNTDEEDVRALIAQLEALKASYAQEVRRLRELDMQVQAIQARVTGKTAQGMPGAPPQAVAAQAAEAGAAAGQPAAPPAEGYASSASEAKQAKEASRRSVDDVKQQQSALFNQRLTLENSLSYARYDRKQLTLNGFLALDAIFLGNIAIENVESDSLTYNFAARWGLNPRLTLNLDVPYIARKTIYQKGGAGGSAAAIAQEETNGTGIGDVTFTANYKLFGERGWRPETVLSGGVTAPTGREPYGLDWEVIERDDDDFIRFAVPAEQPTGNGVWQANIGLSAVKTADPAILFANVGYIYSFERSFDDIDGNPDTINPGDVKLGDSFYFGAGVAFAFNERTSLSISFSDKLSARASTRYKDGKWMKVIGSDANAGTLNLGVTYALTSKATFVSMLGIGLTPDAPDFSLAFKVPYML
ncbi:transporter [Stenotrophomonas sp. SY1]|uniref:transporter n=1 Tax=Stenotrophomonas sp. SY1 TaxID=477235 RepID=UPI001E4A5025|nr:transporter [Stenotrophomonas sp. SY1]MCD9086540.1 transporter [Stenotrophomonas sp. SY1]